jgi:GNAT superfamily N-acetyltransferase
MAEFAIREMRPEDRLDVAELICLSTNSWYSSHGRELVFTGGPQATELHYDVYHALEGSSGIVAEDARTSRLIGSCFQHIRPTHVSLGIMNVHPNHFGRGVAGALLRNIIQTAEALDRPVRLVSSAMNLDSYSLYTHSGFVPRCAFQDMWMKVPSRGFGVKVQGVSQVRDAVLADIPLMAALEMEVSHVRRDSDYRHFIENPLGIWHVSVFEGEDGQLDGFLVSCAHPGCNMLGPGVMRNDDEVATALLVAELNQHKGRAPVFLLPVERNTLVCRAYDWGARNCEIHFAQVRGEFTPFDGITMPTFMPETA